jgi:hypothetical protein
MRDMVSVAIAIAVINGTSTDKASACNLRLPAFEVAGFPISRLQVAVLGAAHVEEGSATPTLKLAGMPASPHQIAVLTPRKPVKIVSAAAELNVAPPALAISDLPIAICVPD